MTESVSLTASSSFISTPEFSLDFIENTYSINNPTGIDALLIHGAKFESILVPFERITEAGDFRVTESGDTRITENISENGAEGSLFATDTYIPFNSELFIKYLTNWKIGTPYINNNNVWVTPISIYRYMDDAWKRVY
jgi:hypothetical protein